MRREPKPKEPKKDPGHVWVRSGTMDNGKPRMTCVNCQVGHLWPNAHEKCAPVKHYDY